MNLIIILGKEPFLLPYKSGKHFRVCEAVARFFHQKLGVHLNPTRIRAIHETCAQMALEKKLITPYEKNCIERTLGHSAQTALRYYSVKDR